MRLRTLTDERIAIQCHNNPDADALAAGFGLFCFFDSEGHYPPKLFYGGPAVTKPNLTAMIEELNIPVEHEPDLKEWDGLLITVDCQYGAGNVAPVSAPRIAVIDHHIQESELPALADLRPWLGSCSTLVWKLLEEAGFSVDVQLGTALHYGLFTDTNGFSEVRHPLDRDMWDSLPVNERILKKLKRSNLALSDLSIASAALKDFHFDPRRRFMVIATPPCDPNLLGFISDLSMQVDAVDLAIVYMPGMEKMDDIKFSVRTAVRETKASELASWLARDIGSGGGHRDKAGGYLAGRKYADQFGDRPLSLYFLAEVREYLDTCTIIDCAAVTSPFSGDLNVKEMKRYRKLPVRLGFVPCHTLFEGHADLQIRMLEGDIDISADEETILMIGLKGEVYPAKYENFIETYTLTGERFAIDFSYPPKVFNKNTGTRVSLPDYAQACESSGEGGGCVLAMRLEKRVKLFTRWDTENYFRGDPGDWIVARSSDDLYIVTADLFDKLYIRDCTDEDISGQPQAVRVLKKSFPVPVTFATKGGSLYTREGRISYELGDALLTGPEGESWPVPKKRFTETYVPLPGTETGSDGVYLKGKFPAWALQIHEPFIVRLPGRGTLRGNRGDWLLQYAPNEYGIVGREIFEKTCDILRSETEAAQFKLN
ncbi:MAG: DHH family phosphoesterase [Synergistaceae bacterium]|jgi:phosphoglycolate phosphatase|nr:DHH family phosphoesterase [Synergistaceae bacterium]